MKSFLKSRLSCALILTVLLFALLPALRAADAPGVTNDTPLRLVIVGDSTVCNYTSTVPTRGWGMYIQERFKKGTVTVINLAASGRSTKTFIQEGRWQKALAEKPNYVLIQFGHNDSHDPSKEGSDRCRDGLQKIPAPLHRRLARDWRDTHPGDTHGVGGRSMPAANWRIPCSVMPTR